MTKAQCQLCNILDGKTDNIIIYESEKFAAILDPEPAFKGQIILFSKKHYTILEEMPDYEAGEMFNIANKLSRVVFESLGVQGTNIIFNNGVAAGQVIPHVSAVILPRLENDGLNLVWQPKELGEEKMSTLTLQLKDAFEGIGNFKKEKKSVSVKLEKDIQKVKEKADNYLFKQIQRIP